MCMKLFNSPKCIYSAFLKGRARNIFHLDSFYWFAIMSNDIIYVVEILMKSKWIIIC